MIQSMGRFSQKIQRIGFNLFLISLCFLPMSADSIAGVVSTAQAKGVQLQVGFEGLLTDFSGPVRSQWAQLDFEPDKQEIYTLEPGSNNIRIFNKHGMEVFMFGDQGDVVLAADIAGGNDGSIYLLARDFTAHAVQVLDFRGRPQANILPNGLPHKFGYFSPNRLEYRNGLLYLLDTNAMKIVSMAPDGTVRQAVDIAEQLQNIAASVSSGENKGVGLDITGFGVGNDGSIYFTAASVFRALRLNIDGTLEAFGSAGSGPGKFGVVSGIGADDQGYIYVADKLRSVVLIFGSNLVYQGEFGYRGGRPQDLIAPNDLAIDPKEGRLFIAQAANKGVGVYKVSVSQSR